LASSRSTSSSSIIVASWTSKSSTMPSCSTSTRPQRGARCELRLTLTTSPKVLLASASTVPLSGTGQRWRVRRLKSTEKFKNYQRKWSLTTSAFKLAKHSFNLKWAHLHRIQLLISNKWCKALSRYDSHQKEARKENVGSSQIIAKWQFCLPMTWQIYPWAQSIKTCKASSPTRWVTCSFRNLGLNLVFSASQASNLGAVTSTPTYSRCTARSNCLP